MKLLICLLFISTTALAQQYSCNDIDYLKRTLRDLHQRCGDTGDLPGRGYICTSSDNRLINSNGVEIYDFSSSTDCRNAIDQLKSSRAFCTGADNRLFNHRGLELYDFSSSTDCRSAIENLKIHNAFCTAGDNKLINRQGKLIHDFSSSADCQRALRDL